MKIKRIHIFIIFLLLHFVLFGQRTECYRFVDTLFVKGHIIEIREECKCDYNYRISFVVSNSRQKKIAVKTFFSEYPLSNINEVPLIISNLDVRQFALMKFYAEDSSSRKYTTRQITESLLYNVPVDSIETMYVWDPNDVEEDMRSIGGFFFAHSLDSYSEFIKPVHRISEKKLTINDRKYIIRKIPFKSWCLLIELKEKCHFQNDHTAEKYLFNRGYEKLRILIPLSKR
jgi:hypothetical protein